MLRQQDCMAPSMVLATSPVPKAFSYSSISSWSLQQYYPPRDLRGDPPIHALGNRYTNLNSERGPCREPTNHFPFSPTHQEQTCPSREPRKTVYVPQRQPCRPQSQLEALKTPYVFNPAPLKHIPKPALTSQQPVQGSGGSPLGELAEATSVHAPGKRLFIWYPIGTFALILALLTKILEAVLSVQRLDRVYAHPSLW